MKRRSKLLLPAIGFVALLLLLVAALQTRPVENYVLRRLSSYLRSSRGIDLSAASLHYNLLTLSAELDSLSMGSAGSANLPPFLTADSVRASVSFLSLIRRRPVIENAVLDGVCVRIVENSKGRSNLPHPPSAAANEDSSGIPGLPLPFLIEDLRARGTLLRFENDDHGFGVELSGWQVEMHGDQSTWVQSLRFHTRQAGRAEYGNRFIPVAGLNLDAELTPSMLKVSDFDLRAGESRIQAEGKAEGFKRPDISATIKADLVAGRFAEVLGLDQPAAGRIKFTATASGPAEKIHVSSEITGENLAIRQITGIDFTGSAIWERDSGRLHIPSLEIRSPHGSASGHADLSLSETAGQSTALIRFRNFGIGPMTEMLLPVRIASRISGSVRGEWPGMKFDHAGAFADLKISAARGRPAPDVLPVDASIRASGSGSRFELKIDTGKVFDMNFGGDVSIESWRNIRGKLEAETDSMESLIAALESFLGRKPGSLIGVELAGPLKVEADLGGTLTMPRAATSIHAFRTRLGRLSDVNLRAQVDYSPGRIAVGNLEALWKEQALTAAGEIRLGGSSPKLNLQIHVADASLGAVAGGMGRHLPLSGRFSLDVNIGGTFADVLGSSSLSMSELTVFGQPLGTLELRAGLDDGRIDLSRMELVQDMSGGTRRLTANGNYSLKTGAFTLTANADQLDLNSLTLPDGTAVRGVLSLTAAGKGSAGNPVLDAEMHLRELKVGSRLLGALNLKTSLRQQRAEIEMDLPRFQIDSRAGIDMHYPYGVRFEAQADTDISKLKIAAAGDEMLKGNLTAIVRGTGELAHWMDASVELVASNFLLMVRDQEIRNRRPIELSYKDRRLNCLSAELVSMDSKFSAIGSLPLEPGARSGTMNIDASLDLSRLSAFFPRQSDLSVKGILSARGVLQGSLKQLNPSVELTMADGVFDHSSLRKELKNIKLDAVYREGLATIQSFSADLGNATIRATGKIPFRIVSAKHSFSVPDAAQTAQFSVDVESLHLNDFSRIPESLGSTISFHADGERVDTKDLGALRAKITFSQLRLKTTRYEIHQSEPVQISIADGELHLDRFLLTAPTARLKADGTVGLIGDQNLNVDLDGQINIGLAALFAEDIRAEGESRFMLKLSGKRSDPQLAGFFEMEKGTFSLKTPALSVSNLNVRLRINRQNVAVETFTGSLNGGDLKIAGETGFGKGGFQNAHLDISVNDAFFNYPDEFRTRSSGNIALRSAGDFLTIGGAVHLLEGSYRKHLDVAGELLDYLRSRGGTQFAGEQNPFLSKLRFNLNIDIEGPLLIDNNLAELNVSGDLRLTGTFYRPGLIGRMSLEEGGKLYFNERTYLVERGVVSFFNQAEIEPNLDILATANVGQYDISLNLTGTPGNFKTDLTSDPPLSKSDIISVLLTGRKLEDLQGSGLNVAREQVESYLSGQMTGFLSQSAKKTIGLSMVRIDPSLINPEANPGARLTVGDDLTSRLFLIYSMNLVNASDQILTIQYDITRNFQTEVTRQSDNSYRFNLGQNLQFGGEAGRSAATGLSKEKIGTVEIGGDIVFERSKLLDKLDMETGGKYNFFKIQKGVERLRRYYRGHGYLESRIQIERKKKNGVVDLSINVEAGPRVVIGYQGREPSGDIRKRVATAWEEGLFDAQRTQEAVRILRGSLERKGYLDAKVSFDVQSPMPDEKKVTFTVQPGVHFSNVVIVFEGASGISPSRLRRVLQDEDLMREIYFDSEKATDFLRDYYRAQGYLDARVEKPKRELDISSKSGHIVLQVREGPQFRIRKLEFDGNHALPDQQLAQALPLAAGEIYSPASVKSAFDRLEEIYWEHGYNNVVVGYTIRRVQEPGCLDIAFQVTENEQQVVKNIEIEGNRETSDGMIRSQIPLKPGEILDYRETNKSRRQLYDTGAYRLVDIQPQPVGGTRKTAEGLEQPVELKVRVKEVRPFELRYSGFYDTERGPGGLADFSNRNSLGSARVLGTRVRYDSDIQELRGYFSQPFLRRFPVESNVTAFLRREFTAGQDTQGSGYTTDLAGFTLQQESTFRNKFILNYGYRFQRNHTYGFVADPSLNTTKITAPLTATLTRDTRNDLLDASRGSFTSQAFEYAPSYLGSDLRYYKFLGQYFHYLPLSAPSRVPWVGSKRSRLVFAGALRVGLADGLDKQDLLQTDKFLAGGGTTIRGFGQNEIGPKDLAGNPIGGDALFILNAELRFPIFSIIDGVGFLDIGNIYPNIRDFNPTNVRSASGLGLRIRTPYFLLRGDYGIKLDRRPGESFGKFFFSIGQAF
jgi:outer membrane protein assembly complex protein YaeT